MTEFRLLGPVEVWAGGRRVEAGPPRQRTVLAALLVDAGRAVSVDTLIDRVWGQDPPQASRQSLHAHIARIRRLLSNAHEPETTPTGLAFDAGCYRLTVDQARVDVHRFRLLSARARSHDHTDHRRLALLREAVGLWRGEPLTGLRGPWSEQIRDTWRQEYVDTAVAWAYTELRLADPTPVIAPLRALTAANPMTESLATVLMQALVAMGRPAEALAHYDAIRRQLSDELGVSPGSELQSIYQAILHGEQPPATDVPAAPTAPAPEVMPAVVPAQLPADVFGFTGRGAHLAQLDALLARTGSDATAAPAAVVISAVSGTAGVGKTALAVRWAHSVANRFPDGQLYVNLRGFDPSGRIVPPADALRGFLDSLGVPAERIPSTLDAQIALYRSQLAGKRILVVLDNARDAEQARPLLPATPTAMALVTSRDLLTSLIATDGAHPLTLDVLSAAEAHDLLVSRLGADRVGAEPGPVDQIVDACARLPLALTITAARAQQTRFPLAVLAAELAHAGHRLDVLDTGDPAAQIRAVFSWSYEALSTPAGRLFRLLGLHPGPDVSAAAAASLAGLAPSQTRRLLHELTRASLLAEHVPGRYAFHDLLRVYAVDLALADDTEADRRAATRRLLDHYTHTAHAADRLVHPTRDPIGLPLAPAAADSRPEDPADEDAALRWFDTEHPGLLVVMRHAVTTGYDAHAWQLAWALDSFLYRRGYWQDTVAGWQIALQAAGSLGDLAAQGYAHRGVAHAVTRLGLLSDAGSHLRDALDVYVTLGDKVGQASVHYNLAILWGELGDRQRALEHAEQALALHEATDNQRGQAYSLNQVGWHHVLLGDPARALPYCQRGLALHQEIGDLMGQAETWDSLGCAHRDLGDHAEAIYCIQHAVDLGRELGDRYTEAEVVMHLGDAQHASGDVEAARTSWTRSLDLLADLGQPDTWDLHAKLDALPETPTQENGVRGRS